MSLKNTVILVGRLPHGPEIVKIETGSKVARFTIGTHEPYKDKNGEWINNVQYHSAFAFGRLAEEIEKKLEKGSDVVLQGRILYRTYEVANGEKRHMTEIEISEFLLLNKKAVEE